MGGARFCWLDGSTEVTLEGTRIEDLINVSHGIDLIFLVPGRKIFRTSAN